jgi:hypothetical protein
MAKWSISFQTLLLFQQRIMCDTGPLGPAEVLEIFAEAEEFSDVTLRNNEKVRARRNV